MISMSGTNQRGQKRQPHTERSLPNQTGFTLTELVIGIVVLAIVAISFATLFTALVRSGLAAKRVAVASSLATNQIEYLKSLPYDNLAVAGGSIYISNPLPATKTEKIDGFTYTIRTSINYIDDAFDGCTTYPTQALKEKLCRNFPPPASVTANDNNAGDYKIVNVSVENATGTKLATLDTQIAARVAETSSTTGALIVNVIDDNGSPVQGATVTVTNTTITPNANLSDSSDASGIAIFYNLPPDSAAFDYTVSASKANFSSLTTIIPSGTLVPTYSSQKVFTQASSYVTLLIKPQGQYSLIAEAVDTSGAALSGIRLYAKGGYKRFTSTTNTTYYFDNLTPSDTRPTTGADGISTFSNLVPGPYYFCGNSGATSCTVGAATRFLVAAIPYSGSDSYLPLDVPISDPTNPPTTTHLYGGNNYLQKARLIFSASSTFPRITTLSENEISLASANLSAFAFSLTGVNLPCSSSAASCSTTVAVLQASNTYTASCTGTSAGTKVDCTVNLTGIVAGSTQLRVASGGNTYTSPADLSLGSFNVVP